MHGPYKKQKSPVEEFCRPRWTSRLSLIMVCLGTMVGSGSAQTARVQFINASTYEEADTIDVYLNGRLLLDDLAYKAGTPFSDYPAAVPLRIEARRGGAAGDAELFYSEIFTFTPGERYFAIAAGDPEKRSGQPPFRFFLQAGAPEGSDLAGYAYAVLFNNDPGGAIYFYARGVEQQADALNRAKPFGRYSDVIPAAKMAWDVDCFQLGTGRARFVVQDYSPLGERSGVFIGLCSFAVLSDGTTFDAVYDNVAHLQLAHIFSSPRADTVDISVDGQIVARALPAGSATALLQVPSGLREETAPDIKIEVWASAAQEEEPLASLERKFLFGHRYVSVLAGSSGDDEGSRPVVLYLTDLGAEATLQEDGGITAVFHGAARPTSIVLGIGEPRIVPLTRRIPVGAIETGVPLPRADTTVTVIDGYDASILARFDLNLASRGWADSSLVLLTSDAPLAGGERQAPSIDVALVAVPPSGGRLVEFEGFSPPPWWKKPWLLLLLASVLVAVAYAGSQVRVRRLESRSRELEKTVAERTRELRAEKAKTEQQARRLVQLDEAKNRFFANISHEFRTPLTLILGPLQDMIDGAHGAFDPGLNRQFVLMRRNTRRLLRLVNQLLDLSKLQSGKRELNRQPGDLIGFLRELVRAFVPLAERRRVALAMESDAESFRARYDADALEKVFSNLISNGLKFTPEGGHVSVRAQVMPVRTGDDGIVEDRKLAVISVQDTGPGIPEEHLDRIFERFQQADTSIRRAHEGSGIGLTLARELAELHGGSLRVESTVGKGSTFIVTLPLEGTDEPLDPDLRPVENVSLEEPLVAIDTDGSSGAGAESREDEPLILVVEDNADVREYVRSQLASSFRIVEAGDGEQGLAAALSETPDLILADVMMPNMDGYEMCRLIKANDDLRHIPVVMLTAKAAERDTLEGLQSGADDYLAKPFSVAELKARILNLIGSRRDLRERFSREVFVRPADIEITPEEEVFLEQLLDVVNSHLGDAGFNVDWLADEMGLSRRPLELRVEAVTGMAPAALIRRLRLERASQLLRARAASVAEIGYTVGFRSPAHFSKAFRRAYGESPTAHMRRSPATD